MRLKPGSVSKKRPSAAHARASSPLAPEAVLARLVALGPDGEPWISNDGKGSEPRHARATVVLGPACVGREVLVCFAGKRRTPVVTGVLIAPGDHQGDATAPALDLLVDRRRIVLSAEQEVVLRCGQASITLTSDGKIVIKGGDVVSSAGRVNRIRGGAVKIN